MKAGTHLLSLIHPARQPYHVKVLFDEVLAPSQVVVFGEPFGDLHRGGIMGQHRVQGPGGYAIGGKSVACPAHRLAAQRLDNTKLGRSLQQLYEPCVQL